jgi:hypothetical protein
MRDVPPVEVQALRFVSGSVSAPSFGILSPSDVEHPVRRRLMDLLMTVPVSKTAGTWARFTRLGGSRHKLSIPLRLHRTLENWIDEDDDDHEIDTRLLPGWLKEVLTEVKGLAAKIKAHLQGDEDGDIIVLEATEEQIVGILKVDRDEARHKAKAKYE